MAKYKTPLAVTCPPLHRQSANVLCTTLGFPRRMKYLVCICLHLWRLEQLFLATYTIIKIVSLEFILCPMHTVYLRPLSICLCEMSSATPITSEFGWLSFVLQRGLFAFDRWWMICGVRSVFRFRTLFIGDNLGMKPCLVSVVLHFTAPTVR